MLAYPGNPCGQIPPCTGYPPIQHAPPRLCPHKKKRRVPSRDVPPNVAASPAAFANIFKTAHRSITGCGELRLTPPRPRLLSFCLYSFARKRPLDLSKVIHYQKYFYRLSYHTLTRKVNLRERSLCFKSAEYKSVIYSCQLIVTCRYYYF